MNASRLLSVVAMSAVLLSAIGCSKSADTATEVAEVSEHAEHGHTHGGWWCSEHGVPESVCALCDSKIAADFQRKGDWCKEHDRPDSQCFECHPELQERFAAQYEAKYGEQPPKPEG